MEGLFSPAVYEGQGEGSLSAVLWKLELKHSTLPGVYYNQRNTKYQLTFFHVTAPRNIIFWIQQIQTSLFL